MKKLSALLLTLAMLLSLAACGGNGGTTPPAQENTPPAQADGGDKQDAPAPAPADDASLTETQKIIKEAEGMSLEELA